MPTLNLSQRSGKWWDNFMQEKAPGGLIDDINKALIEYNAELVFTTEGEQILFKNEDYRVMFLPRWS